MSLHHRVFRAEDDEAATIMDVRPTMAPGLRVEASGSSEGLCGVCSDVVTSADGEPDYATDGPVVVILPTYNEAESVADVVRRVPARVLGRATEVVVVDDGSTDQSAHLAAEAGAVVLSHGRNQGLGAAIRTGFAHARHRNAAALAFLDADGEYDPTELERLLAPILADQADYVVGDRFASGRPPMRPTQYLGNRVLTILTSILARRRLGDGQSGFRALSREAFGAAEIDHDYNYAQVLTLDLARKGFRYGRVPISYEPRSVGESFIRPVRYLRAVVPAMIRVGLAR